jgi:hypothetical protein
MLCVVGFEPEELAIRKLLIDPIVAEKKLWDKYILLKRSSKSPWLNQIRIQVWLKSLVLLVENKLHFRSRHLQMI